MEDVKEIVRKKYARLAQINEESCCGSPQDSKAEEVTFFSEDYTKKGGYVADADLKLGCGMPTDFARIKPGQSVLDLGSGAGNDVFVARSLTGEKGEVFGIDFTEEMVSKARTNKAKLGYENVHFIQGDIEDMPIPSNSIDIAVSNCVMNLVPNKPKAYSEVYRVLKPGGHFSISDIVIVGELTEAVRNAAALYAGCVSGALQKDLYLDTIKAAGFKNLQLDKERLIELPDSLLIQHIDQSELEAFRASKASIYSINVYAEKPVAGNCC